MLDGRVLGASQVEYKPFGKPPLKREPEGRSKMRPRQIRPRLNRHLRRQLVAVRDQQIRRTQMCWEDSVRAAPGKGF